MRMDALRQSGRSVVLVGDFNIAPAPIDSCDPGSGPELAAWISRADRALLRSHLQSLGGAYVDIFRTFHPHRCSCLPLDNHSGAGACLLMQAVVRGRR